MGQEVVVMVTQAALWRLGVIESDLVAREHAKCISYPRLPAWGSS